MLFLPARAMMMGNCANAYVLAPLHVKALADSQQLQLDLPNDALHRAVHLHISYDPAGKEQSLQFSP